MSTTVRTKLRNASRAKLALAAAALLATSVVVAAAACGYWYLETRSAPATVRQRAPAFSLPDHEGRKVSLDSLLARGPAVLVFYRGHW